MARADPVDVLSQLAPLVRREAVIAVVTVDQVRTVVKDRVADVRPRYVDSLPPAVLPDGRSGPETRLSQAQPAVAEHRHQRVDVAAVEAAAALQRVAHPPSLEVGLRESIDVVAELSDFVVVKTGDVVETLE